MEIASIQRRFCAYLIDELIMLLLGLPLIILILICFIYYGDIVGDLSVIHLLRIVIDVLCIYMECNYYAHFISSEAQATPGQQLLNICTISLDQHKIDRNLAFNRSLFCFFLPTLGHILDILTHIIEQLADILNMLRIFLIILNLFWNLMACFSEKKQAFHDMLCNTVIVVKKR